MNQPFLYICLLEIISNVIVSIILLKSYYLDLLLSNKTSTFFRCWIKILLDWCCRISNKSSITAKNPRIAMRSIVDNCVILDWSYENRLIPTFWTMLLVNLLSSKHLCFCHHRFGHISVLLSDGNEWIIWKFALLLILLNLLETLLFT